jgi:hypothetical protein
MTIKRIALILLLLATIPLLCASAQLPAPDGPNESEDILSIPDEAQSSTGDVLSQVGRLTYYHASLEGNRHACANTPPVGFTPTAAFEDQPGLATGDRSIPCGTVILLEIVGIPSWAQGRYDDVVGRRTVGVVVDRLRDPHPHTYDAYPNLFAQLVGEERRNSLGVVYVRAEVIGHLPTR